MTALALGFGLLFTLLGATAGVALLAVSRAELTRAVSRQLRGGAGALDWFGRVERYLAAASVTTSLGVALLGATLPATFRGWGLAAAALLVALVAVPAVFLSGHLAARWLSLARAERMVRLMVPVLEPWSRLLGLVLPARRPSPPADFRAIWHEGTAVGLRTDEDLQLVGGVIAFAHQPVREVMTPRTDLVAIPEDASLHDIREVFAQSGYSRVPVYRETLDEIIGMVYAFDLFKLAPGASLPVRPVAVAPASRSAGDLLLDMQRERRHLAVVLDEFGGTLGIATLEDLLEELVGEIFDEFDGAAGAARGGTEVVVFEADGSVPTAAIEERFGVRLPAVSAGTIGGLLAELAGRIPQTGERFALEGLEFDVVHASATRAERLLIRPGPVSSIPLVREFP